MSKTLGSLVKRDRYIPVIDLTSNDIRALRAEAKSAAFLHIPRLAQRWGVAVGTVRHLLQPQLKGVT